MKYQVEIETPKSAIVKTSYLNRDFKYVFLDITFEPVSTGSTIKAGKGKYLFTSVPLESQLPMGDPARHKIIRQEFHRRCDINTLVKATSLEEACGAFFESFGDTFEIVQQAPPPPPAPPKSKAKAPRLSRVSR